MRRRTLTADRDAAGRLSRERTGEVITACTIGSRTFSVRKFDRSVQAFGGYFVAAIVLAIGQRHLQCADRFDRRARARYLDHVVGAAVLHQRRQGFERGGVVDLILQVGREERRESHQRGELRRISDREPIRHHAALAEAEHHQLFAIDRIFFQRLVEKLGHHLVGVVDCAAIGRRAHPNRKPCVAARRTDRHFHRTLRTNQHEAAVGDVRRESEQVERAGAEPVHRDQRRMRPLAGRLIDSMDQSHRCVLLGGIAA